MNADMVAALERQYTATPTPDGNTVHQWRLVKQWDTDRDDAPIWTALEALAGEVQW